MDELFFENGRITNRRNKANYKQALVKAYASKDLDRIAELTKAILFLGTPHRGSSFTLLGRLAAQALRPLGSNPSLLAEVEYDSTFLLDLHESFLDVVHDKLHVVNFFEERPTHILQFWFYQWREFVSEPCQAVYNILIAGAVRS